MELFLCALGLAMVLEGLPYFTVPGQVKELARRLPEVPNATIRILGFAVIAAGLLVIFLGRRLF